MVISFEGVIDVEGLVGFLCEFGVGVFCGVFEDLMDGLGKIFRVGWFDGEAHAGLFDGDTDSGEVGGDDGSTQLHGFDLNHTKSFGVIDGREKKDVDVFIESSQVSPTEIAKEAMLDLVLFEQMGDVVKVI